MTPYTLDDAEKALQAAIHANDAGEIERLGRIIDELDPRHAATVPSLHGSALWYAEHGLKVFPLQPGAKVPFKGSRGCKDATSDPEKINAWWGRSPDANVAIATGHLVDVVDIDGPIGQASRATEWDTLFGAIDADNIGKVLTPRAGGMHIYVPATGRGNAANIAPNVDYRGVGGYVVAPPSRTDVGTYRWLGTPRIVAAQAGAA